jgi:hypothetical protein
VWVSTERRAWSDMTISWISAGLAKSHDFSRNCARPDPYRTTWIREPRRC